MFNLLDTVVLAHDLPDRGLLAGDIGAIVALHESGEFEAEFVTASGSTAALVTLGPRDVRVAGDRDLLAVRSLERKAG